MSAFIRGEGGWGGDRGPSGPRNVPPDRDPDHVVSYTTRTDQALLYRLNGDRNPLHSDPKFAARCRVPEADPPRPLHVRVHRPGALARGVRQRPDAVQGVEGRFSNPVMPGDTLDVRIWVDGNEAIFQTWAGENMVIDSGKLTFE